MTPPTASQLAQVAAALQHQIAAQKTPGLYYAFFDAEKIQYECTVGKSDLSSGLSATAQTAFYGYSVTKTFTSTAVLQLAAQGKLRLDDPVKTHLPAFAYGDAITVRQLLAHSSGLPNPLPIRWIHLVEAHAAFDEARFLAGVFQQNPKARRQPNEHFAYTNLGYLVLGQLIEKCSGMPYPAYVTEHILKPLGVSEQLGFERQSQWNVATGYQKAFSFGNLLLGFLLDKKKYMGDTTAGWKSFRPIYVNGAAYGGLIGTPGAFITFAQDFLKPESRLLSRAQRDEMFSENHLNDGKASGMCLGWFCSHLNGHRFVAHAGGGGGFYCELRVYPETGMGSILMTNRSGFSDERLLNGFDRYLLAQ